MSQGQVVFAREKAGDIQTEPVRKSKGTVTEKITPFLWFDSQAEEAVNFYTSIFKNSQTKYITHYNAESAKASGNKEGQVMTISFQIEGQEFTAINAGPVFQINPSISFFVSCDTTEEVDKLWSKLSVGGEALMALDKYPFSEKYGWIKDKFGVSWQLIYPGRKQKIAPCLLFTGQHFYLAEEAINFYISIFRNPNLPADSSGILQLEHYPAGTRDVGAVMHAKFSLNGQEFIAMDSSLDHKFDFNPAISFVVSCKNQKELDYYWDKLTEGGPEEAQICGWLADKYGVSWQLVPDNLGEMLSDADPARSARVMREVMKMKKLDIKTMQQAYDGILPD